MLKKIPLFALVLIACYQFACEKEAEEEPELEILDLPTAIGTGPTSVEINWVTNLPANSVVYYGLTEALEDTVRDEEEREQHTIMLTDLAPDTVYYFQVESSSRHFTGTPRSDVGQFSTSMNEQSYTILGWSYFSQGEYGEALTAFVNALDMNNNHAGAYVGLGWVYIRMEDLDESLTNFNTGLGLDNSLLVGYAGRALVHLGKQLYTEAINDARTVIETDSSYTFNYDPGINHIMVRLALAQAYYATQEYQLAQEQCDVIDPENGLDPVLPGSWVVNGVTYGTYLEALLGLIQYLVLQQGGG